MIYGDIYSKMSIKKLTKSFEEEDLYNKMYDKQKEESFLWKFISHWEIYRDEVILKLIGMKKEGSMLDIGCGDGDFIIKARGLFKEITGIDISSIRLQKAKSKLNKLKINNIRLKKVNVNQGLPFRDEKFDVITTIAVLEHLFDPYFVISEARRVLKKNGIIFIEVPNIAFILRRLELLFGILPGTSNQSGWDGGHLHYFTESSLKKLLEDSGFQVIKITGSGIFANLRSWWPSLLCGDIIIKAIKK